MQIDPLASPIAKYPPSCVIAAANGRSQSGPKVDRLPERKSHKTSWYALFQMTTRSDLSNNAPEGLRDGRFRGLLTSAVS